MNSKVEHTAEGVSLPEPPGSVPAVSNLFSSPASASGTGVPEDARPRSSQTALQPDAALRVKEKRQLFRGSRVSLLFAVAIVLLLLLALALVISPLKSVR